MSTGKDQFLGEIKEGPSFFARIARECGAVVVESDPPAHLARMGMIKMRTFENPDGSELTKQQKKYLTRCMRDNIVHPFDDARE